jgi:hypothetical protein
MTPLHSDAARGHDVEREWDWRTGETPARVSLVASFGVR